MIPRVLWLFFSRRFAGLDFKLELSTGWEGLRIINSFSFNATGARRDGEDSGRDLYPVRNNSVGARCFDSGSNVAVAVFLPAISVGPETHCHVKNQENESDL